VTSRFIQPWTRREFLATTSVAAAGLAIGCHSKSDLTATPADDMLVDPTSLGPVLAEIVHELETRVPYASALMLRSATTQISINNQTQSIDEAGQNQGVVLRVFNGEYFEEAATTELSPDALHKLGRDLAARVKVRPGGEDVNPGPGGTKHFATERVVDPLKLPLQDHFERTAALHEQARAIDTDLANCQVGYTQRLEDVVFVNRAKQWSQQLIRLRAGVRYYASDGSQTVSDFDSRGGTGGLELLKFSNEELLALAVETRALLSAKSVEPGEYTVITDPTTSGTVAHESFGHGVELDMFVKDRALAERYVGKRVGSDFVNIYDDPSLPGAFGSYFFDHEGQPASSTEIVRQGIFLRGLSDQMSARALGIARSANGRRQDFSRKVYARMSNTCFARGETPLGELIGGVEHGYLLQKLTHGMEDPKGWGIQLGVKIGREIKKGQLTGTIVSPVGITGFVPDVLGSIDGTASDFKTDTGWCGKGHKEYVPVSTGGPHLRFRAQLS